MQNARGTKMSKRSIFETVYLNKNALKKEILSISTSPLNEWDTWGVLNAIDRVEPADVAPVVHAYNKSKDSFLCSACTFGDFGLFNHGGKYTPKYCPNCGARMDGGRNDG